MGWLLNHAAKPANCKSPGSKVCSAILLRHRGSSMAGPGSVLIGYKPNRDDCAAARLVEWKVVFLCGVLLLLCEPARSQGSMHVGVCLGEYYSFAVATPVQVHLPAASVARLIDLEFVLRSGSE